MSVLQVMARNVAFRSVLDYYDYPNGPGTSGHNDVKTTMIYTHVLNRGPAGVRSPVDGF